MRWNNGLHGKLNKAVNRTFFRNKTDATPATATVKRVCASGFRYQTNLESHVASLKQASTETWPWYSLQHSGRSLRFECDLWYFINWLFCSNADVNACVTETRTMNTKNTYATSNIDSHMSHCVSNNMRNSQILTATDCTNTNRLRWLGSSNYSCRHCQLRCATSKPLCLWALSTVAASRSTLQATSSNFGGRKHLQQFKLIAKTILCWNRTHRLESRMNCFCTLNLRLSLRSQNTWSAKI